jgi:hypothetical protein
MTTIHVPMVVEETTTVESYEDGRRYRWTINRMRKPDGEIHVHTECVEVEDVGPLTIIMPGPDVDAIATRDLLQAAKGKKLKQREKVDLVAYYQHMQEARRRELDSKTSHPITQTW